MSNNLSDIVLSASRKSFWAPGQSVTMAAATRLVAPDWTPLLTTAIPASGLLEFTDPDAADHATRFSRIVAP